jgi:LPS sulfotransferase NodH
LVRAQQTGAWNSELAGDRDAQYDPARIATAVEFLRRSDEQWRQLFARQGITPITSTYESLAADYEAAVGSVLAALDLGHLAVAPPPLERQADATTEEWVARFLSEHASPGQPGPEA